MSFKVLCINDNGWEEEKKYFFGLFKRTIDWGELPAYGEMCTVDESLCNEKYYWIVEYNDHYSKPEFIPISEIDETEFIREIKTHKV